ncbi:MAG: hypothetical protein L0Z53_15170, partial [Acidobacteriales bacterium]|nr:hypothetical protein [Terriglobales bacterium]
MELPRPNIKLAVVLMASMILPGALAQAGGVQEPEIAQCGARKDRIATLISIVKDRELLKNDPERVEAAIQQLGELRAEEAIDPLISMLDYEAYKFRRKDQWFITASGEREYPVVYALASIGRPAVPAIVRLLEKTEPETRLAVNARQTLILLFGDNPGEGIDLVEAAARKSETAQGSLRLRAAVDELRNFEELLRESTRGFRRNATLTRAAERGFMLLRLADIMTGGLISAGLLILCACGLLAQEPKALEPELLGVVYYLDSDKGQLVPLERQAARQATSGGGFFFGQYKRRIKVDGAKSPIRFAQGQKLEFVVSGGELQLYPLESKKDRR